MNPPAAYAFALASSACFAFASLIFADLSRRVSPLWMNAFKALIAWLCFGSAVVLFSGWIPLDPLVFGGLFLSGILGLAIGDIFLLTAYARMGAARTLILYGFQPLFIGVAAHFLFHQSLNWMHALAVLFFLACLFVFSLERYRQNGHWELWGLVAALVAVLFDNCGLLLSRWAFERTPDLNAFQANLVRCSGALLLFVLIGRVWEVHFRRHWAGLDAKGRSMALVSSMMGTFLSLFFYLTAVRIGHLASISALSGAGPLIASGLECMWRRKAPSVYLIIALVLFLVGFYVLTLA